MSARPSMQARDSSGRQVSLLNDEYQAYGAFISRPADHSDNQSSMVRSSSARSNTSSPLTPSLIRADSFDSNMNDPLSPITPNSSLEFGRHNSSTNANTHEHDHLDYREKMPSYEEYSKSQYGTAVRPQYFESRNATYADPQLYEEEYASGPDRGLASQKRYPCRYRDSHGCEKTFTTSGHASRHSKIHTAEKAVCCLHPGCQKKFTRSDNMKQHLETHNKERTRSTTSKIPSKTLTVSAGIKKGSPLMHPSRPSSRDAITSVISEETPLPLDPAMFTQPLYSMNASHGTFSTFSSPSSSHFSFQDSAHAHPIIPERGIPQSGLDTLANVAAASCT
jgi:hypothetical protein